MPIGLAAALELLRALALRTVYRPADDGAPVTVSPFLADPVVIYDGIWAGSLECRSSCRCHPRPTRSCHAVLTIDGGSSPKRALTAAAPTREALLASWQRGTQELVLSVPSRDEDRELLPSPYLAGIDLTAQTPRKPLAAAAPAPGRPASNGSST